MHDKEVWASLLFVMQSRPHRKRGHRIKRGCFFADFLENHVGHGPAELLGGRVSHISTSRELSGKGKGSMIVATSTCPTATKRPTAIAMLRTANIFNEIRDSRFLSMSDIQQLSAGILIRNHEKTC